MENKKELIKHNAISKQYATAVKDIEAKATAKNNTVYNQPE